MTERKVPRIEPHRMILIVEDDLRLGSFTRIALASEGYKVHLVLTGSEARRYLESHAVDLILLDLELPDIHGVDLCREFSTRFDIPILVFSAEARVKTKVEALNMGARDYIVKPVDIRELAARVRAQISLQKKPEHSLFLAQGNLHYDCASKTFSVDRKPLVLSETLKALLGLLMEHPGETFSKKELYERIWSVDYQSRSDSHTVETHISRLRRQLKKNGCHCMIRNRYRKGYYLTSDAPCSTKAG